MKNLVVIGSTGSIGRQTLDVARRFPDRLRVVGLAARRDAGRLARQIAEFRPAMAHLAEGDASGWEAQDVDIREMVTHPQADVVVMATTGRVGLLPTLAAVRAGQQVVLANKEVLVMAGEVVMAEARRSGGRIVPVDSEHSAIWQCLRGEDKAPSKIILTASGGPFRHCSRTELESVTPSQALNHPSWKMGRKVTIDSATLMNKGLEVIEARWLFDMPFDRIQVVVHPQSIIHSMVEFADGSTKAQLSQPDMRLPIQYALSYPERWPNENLAKMSWEKTKELTFEAPDVESFPCLKLAVEAGKRGGTYPAVLCAADETAVELFLSGQIKFTDIARLVEQLLFEHQSIFHPSLDQIMAADDWAREKTLELAAGAYRC